ncbi:MAG: GNAT family N-acetyltransferase [Myxococcota bacterium]|nr:GNAT family N-acetyltransferase [Myxococcota bacterium]
MTIRLATTDDELRAAFPVMKQLRPHLELDAFVAQARRQQHAHGWSLAVRFDGERVVACAGYRIGEWLAWGKALYVDDLVTDESARSGGHGDALFEWLCDAARAADCAQLHLDSGVQRFAAHRFYLRKRMNITSHHFARKL